jgi:hypothetical protein
VRVIDVADGTERVIDLPACAIDNAALEGDHLAMRVYDRTTTTIGLYRIEAIDLGGPTLRSIARIEHANGHDVSLVDGGAAAVFVSADGIAQRLDLASGSVTPVSAIASSVTGVALTRSGWLEARARTIGTRLWLAGTEAGTTLLDWTRATDHPAAAIAYELGGTAYVIGHDGHVRATIHAIDGGAIVRSVGGAFSTTPGARDALRVRDGDRLLACDASMDAQHVPGLLEALVL